MSDRVFISYSHDSEAHRDAIRRLADRLREDGVDCWIDQYEPAPSEGWPQWMRKRVKNSRYVLVVCTETYRRRLDLEEAPGRGLGATWEAGLITLEVYAAQGRNEKFIPVVLRAEDRQFIPDFLQGSTHYDLGTEGGYTDLYARLTGQVRVPVPPLGTRRTVGTARPRGEQETSEHGSTRANREALAADPLALIRTADELQFISARSFEQRGATAVLSLLPNREEGVFLTGLADSRRRERFWIAFGLSAYGAQVEESERIHGNGGDIWKLSLHLEEDHAGSWTEMATSGKSADQIAELRARRLLLDEKPPSEVERWGQLDNTLEMLVRGLDQERQVVCSPFPELFHSLGRNPQRFLAVAHLLGVLELCRTGTVAHVLQLDLEFRRADVLFVRFRGRRRKMYTNQPAYEIAFEGTCDLQPRP